MKEHVVQFGKTSLVGVITDPPERQAAGGLPAIILLNSGLVHRVGPGRVYVKLARQLAGMGFVVLRFDLAGIGDSPDRKDDLPFPNSAIADTQEAMDVLQASRGTDRFVLMGICLGATVSYFAAHTDHRVVAAVLINGIDYVNSQNKELELELRRRTLSRHYTRMVLFSSFSRNKWVRAFTGNVSYRQIVGMIARKITGSVARLFARVRSKARVAGSANVSHELRGAEAHVRQLIERGVRLFIIHSEADKGLDYLHVILGDKVSEWSDHGDLDLAIISGADHTFTLLPSQESLVRITCDWARAIVDAHDRVATAPPPGGAVTGSQTP